MSKGMLEGIDAYPLCWPEGWKRTNPNARISGAFKGQPGQIRDRLIDEVSMLVVGRGWNYNGTILSTNVPVRLDGLPYVNHKQPEDPGVAIYFERKKEQICIATDQYDRVWKNMRAIQKTIEALRGIERWGSAELLNRAFTGFKALPEPTVLIPWYVVLEFKTDEISIEDAESAYRRLAKMYHPDVCSAGNLLMTDLNIAIAEARKVLSL